MSRRVIGSGADPGSRGRWATWWAAARKDLDNDHAATAARARRAMIGRGVRIDCVVRCWWIGLQYWGGDQLLGARNVGLAASVGQRPVVADAMKPLRQNDGATAARGAAITPDSDIRCRAGRKPDRW